MDNVAVVVVVLIVVVVVVVNCCANVAQLRLLDIPVFCLVFKTKSLLNQTHIHTLSHTYTVILPHKHTFVLLPQSPTHLLSFSHYTLTHSLSHLLIAISNSHAYFYAIILYLLLCILTHIIFDI